MLTYVYCVCDHRGKEVPLFKFPLSLDGCEPHWKQARPVRPHEIIAPRKWASGAPQLD